MRSLSPVLGPGSYTYRSILSMVFFLSFSNHIPHIILRLYNIGCVLCVRVGNAFQNGVRMRLRIKFHQYSERRRIVYNSNISHLLKH